MSFDIVKDMIYEKLAAGDASITFRDRDVAWCMNHYRDIIVDYLSALATDEGRADLSVARARPIVLESLASLAQ